MSSGMNGTISRGVFGSVDEMQSADLRVGVRVDVYGGDTYDIYAENQGASIPLDNGLWAEVVDKPVDGYKGLWPDTGGSALKGETWQTQVGGTPTGEYYTALKDTNVDPVGDNVNWKANNDYGSVSGDGLVVKHRRGTTAENNSFTGGIAELVVDTSTNTMRLHDGATVGGHTVPTAESHLGWVVPEILMPEVDDTGSLQRAVDTLKPVRLTKNSYNISGRITLPNAAIIEGKGKLKCTINLTTADAELYNQVGFNLRLKGFSVNCGNVAEKGITLGEVGFISAHHIIDDVAVYGHKVHGVRLTGGIYHLLTDSVYIHGGTGAGIILDDTSVSVINGRHYNNGLGSVIIQRKSGYNTVNGKLYNDVAFPSDFLMKIDSAFGNKINCDFEPQGAGNVRASLLLSKTFTGTNTNCSDNEINGEFIGLPTTSTEAHVIVGDDGAAFKTKFNNVAFLNLTSAPDILLKNQADTSISRCQNKLTYDTPTFTEADIQNDSGNPYYETSIKSETFLEQSGQFTPYLDSITPPTVTYTNQIGYYTKQGNLVSFDIYISVSAFSGGSGGVTIAGLPFAQTSAGQRRASCAVGGYNIATSDNVHAIVAEGEDYIQLLKSGNSSLGAVVTTDFTDSSSVRVSGTYTVA